MTFPDSPVQRPISLAIFDATGITSDLLNRAFSKQPEYVIVGCLRSIQETVRIVIDMRPDAVIISAFEKSGSLAAIKLLDELSLLGSATRAVILSANLTNDEAVAYFRAQARGVLSGSSADFETLCKCVSCVHAGQIWANSEQLVSLVRSLSKPRTLRIVNADGLPILSTREHEVLHLLAEGLSNRDLAKTLKLSEHTVRNHLFHIFDKLGVSSRMEAVIYALNHRKDRIHPAKAPASMSDISSRRGSEAIAVNE